MFSTLEVRQVFARLDAQAVGATLGKTDGLFSLRVHVKESETADSSPNGANRSRRAKGKKWLKLFRLHSGTVGCSWETRGKINNSWRRWEYYFSRGSARIDLPTGNQSLHAQAGGSRGVARATDELQLGATLDSALFQHSISGPLLKFRAVTSRSRFKGSVQISYPAQQLSTSPRHPLTRSAFGASPSSISPGTLQSMLHCPHLPYGCYPASLSSARSAVDVLHIYDHWGTHLSTSHLRFPGIGRTKICGGVSEPRKSCPDACLCIT